MKLASHLAPQHGLQNCSESNLAEARVCAGECDPPDQTYTVPDRSIFNNLFLVQDLLELGRRDGLSFALLSLDQEKAFDRVDHGYLLSTLRVFGFGPQFVGFLWVLYAATECLVKLNWTLTEPVNFEGGEPELRLDLSAYANDVLLVVQDPGHLARVEACQAIYSAASSARVNWVKSSGLVVGDWRQNFACILGDVLDIESEWTFFRASIIEEATKSCGLKAVVACHSGNPRTCWWTPVVREAVKSKKEAFRATHVNWTPDMAERYQLAKRAAAMAVIEAKAQERVQRDHGE
ncbi:unnamed protein product [Caretta caretta]